jgi:hypothetical protein
MPPPAGELMAVRPAQHSELMVKDALLPDSAPIFRLLSGNSTEAFVRRWYRWPVLMWFLLLAAP